MRTTLRVRCGLPSMLLSDGQIVELGEEFDLPFTDDTAGRARAQRYIEEGTVELWQPEPNWWRRRPATIRLQALSEMSSVITRGTVFEHGASTSPQPYNPDFTERQHAQLLVRSGVAILVDEPPAWWAAHARGQNAGEPLPTPPPLAA